MPAETHQHGEALDEEAVLGIVAAALGLDDDLDPTQPLADLGVDGDLALLHLWEAVAEEVAERSVALVDPDDLDVVTVGDLCRSVLEATTG